MSRLTLLVKSRPFISRPWEGMSPEGCRRFFLLSNVIDKRPFLCALFLCNQQSQHDLNASGVHSNWMVKINWTVTIQMRTGPRRPAGVVHTTSASPVHGDGTE